ncbi:TetR/AcrR family transcriptional regulator [Tsukamurella sp. PLM1]|uniref:TetR/AcrR family transcriptional regulator n=1 Tax=Tsukamurella sp. PLM1 TaxID=2929795 RepID=UPI00353020A5
MKGYDATSLQDIADAVGVSRPALYHYLSSKEDLLVMLVERVSRDLADVIEELRKRSDLAPTEKITLLTEQLVQQRAEHPSQFRILDRSEMMLPEEAGAEHARAKRRCCARPSPSSRRASSRGSSCPSTPAPPP